MDTDDKTGFDVLEDQLPSRERPGSTEQRLAGESSSADKLSADILEENSRIKEQLRQLEKRHKSVVDKLTEERDAAQKELDFIKNDHSLVVCLIDGDGAIFEQEYLKKKEKGGREAAQKLVTGIKDHIKKHFSVALPGIHVMVNLFYARAGLRRSLLNEGKCTSEELEDFFRGFVQADPLINVVDVGRGKEAADDKMREHLDLFLRNPQTKIIFFGGSHDTGYRGPLLAAQTHGWKEKIVLLKYFSDIPYDIQALDFPILHIPGLFLPQKLPPYATPSNRLPDLPGDQTMDTKPPSNQTIQDAELSSDNEGPSRSSFGALGLPYRWKAPFTRSPPQKNTRLPEFNSPPITSQSFPSMPSRPQLGHKRHNSEGQTVRYPQE